MAEALRLQTAAEIVGRERFDDAARTLDDLLRGLADREARGSEPGG